MAKKPVTTEETGGSEIAEVAVPEPASTLPVAPEGYTLIPTAELDDLRAKLKQSR